MPYPQVAGSLYRCAKNNTTLVERAKVWRGCRIVLALLVSHPCETLGKHYHASLRLRSLGSARPCADSHLCRCIVQRLCVAVFMHPCITTLCDRHRASLHVYERSVGFASLRNFGRSFYKASMPYPQVAGSPSRRTKNNTPLVEQGIIFGADGGGRTRTVLLPTDFESVTSANSITSAY